MAKESMTPKERWLAVLQRKTPDRVPMDYWGTDETMDILLRHLGCNDPWEVFRKLHIDRVWSVRPEYVGPPVPDDHDVFGCKFRDVSYGLGVYRECVYHPLAQYDTVEEVKANYTWPDPDWWDFTCIADQLVGKEEYPVQGGGSVPFLIYARMRGMEQAYMDLLADPELVLYCLDQLFDLAYTETLRIYEQICQPAPPQGVNPKTFKLVAGLAAAQGDVICVLDDDTILPDNGLEQCLPYLDKPGAGLAFGLPYQVNFSNVWSSLIALFVNANSLPTYIPYASLHEPVTINGMFYALRRPVLDRMDGFSCSACSSARHRSSPALWRPTLLTPT